MVDYFTGMLLGNLAKRAQDIAGSYIGEQERQKQLAEQIRLWRLTQGMPTVTPPAIRTGQIQTQITPSGLQAGQTRLPPSLSLIGQQPTEIIQPPTRPAEEEEIQQFGLGEEVPGFRIEPKSIIDETKDVYGWVNGEYKKIATIPKGSISAPGYVGLEKKVEEKRALTRATKEEDINLKRQILRQDLDDFIKIDTAIPRGAGAGRFGVGLVSTAKGVLQTKGTGTAVAQHDALSKRLRVSLVRAAGDVGNLNIVEQEAAEKILPSVWDSDDVSKSKRQILINLTKAINIGDSSKIRSILNNAGVSYTEKTEGGQDEFGFTIGEKRTIDGREVTYMGNDEWE